MDFIAGLLKDAGLGGPPWLVVALAAAIPCLVILMFGALILQLLNLQVIKGDEYKQRAEINAIREVPLLPARPEPHTPGRTLPHSTRPIAAVPAR